MRGTIISVVTEYEGQRSWRDRAVEGAQHHAAMLLFLPVVAWLALSVHRSGHAWGDDFALYVRQAQSLFDGNVGKVIADNHFNVDNAANPGFSPYVYPWGWPLLLSPFLRLFGLQYDRLKWVEVACMCGFLFFFHELLRVRMHRWVAFATIISLGTTLAYLLHTDHLLSEFPFMLATAITLWWLDRCRQGHHRLHMATQRQLVVLGLLAVAVFNIRREGLAMIAAIGVVQLIDLHGRWRIADRRRVATPYVTFVVGVIAFQLLLPSALAPSYDGAGLHQTWKKLKGPYRVAFGNQLGLEGLAGVGLLLVILLGVAGVIVRMWRAPSRDAGMAVFAIGSMTIAGMIPANAERYLMAATPFALYFGVQALAALPVPGRRGWWVALAALAALTVHHLSPLADTIETTQQRIDRGINAWDGPESEYMQPAWDAVRTLTRQDDVIAFNKVRALSLYTRRRGVQSSLLEPIQQRADFYLMRRRDGKPQVSATEATDMGWTAVWSDANWVMWRIMPPTP